MNIKRGILYLFIPVCLLGSTAVFGQGNPPFRSAENSLYWKNRMPFEGYWQQDVHYQIKVKIDDETETVGGTEQLTYWNNSPDTLHEVYFHLYQNAFLPGSHLHNMRKAGKLETVFGTYESEGKGTVIESMECTNGIRSQKLYGTVLKLELNRPILPNTSTTFNISFTTYWDKDDKGNIRRRMKTFYHGEEFDKRFKHFDGVHWYPRIAVYDRKFGWTTDEHLGKEFYGDYGAYDVELTFPARYVVEATGELVNRAEVLPDALRNQLDISNFKTKRDIYTGITEELKGEKTWKFSALNVHDFAFTADPTYRIGEVMYKGVRCIALAQEENAHNWQPTAEFVSKVVETYSRDFGEYAYPKIVAADARDGMEYPMITLNGGSWPGHKYVIAHEVGHNWFFGMVGNNETYRASMDEGFTQFLTAWSLKNISNIDYRPNPMDDAMVFRSYIAHASDENTARLNVHSDHFNSAERHGGGYGQVYYKTASMLYNLQYVLGDDLFLVAMKDYFDRWKFCHPYWEDFRNSVMHSTKTDLNWFFDEWIENTSVIDYELKSVKRNNEKGYYEVKIRRNGMQMPLDITVTDKDGGKHLFYIPNAHFVKKDAGTVLPIWFGWGMLNPEYTAIIHVPGGISNVEIDASGRMADINRLNNSKKGSTEVKFDKMDYMRSDFRKYYIYYRPDVWYNDVDGIKAGIAVRSGFNERRHLVNAKIWYNTGVPVDEREDGTGDPLPVNFRLNYRHRVGRMLDLNLASRYIDGLSLNELGLEKNFGNNNVFTLSGRHMMRDNLRFVYHPELWTQDRHDITINTHLIHYYSYFKGSGKIDLGLRTSGLYSDFAYSRASLEVINNTTLGKFQFRTRTFAAVMTGANINAASYIMLAGANEEELMDNKFTRSTGILPGEWMGYGNQLGNFHMSGGLNIRGYSGFTAVNYNDGDTFAVHYGTRGASVNAELDFTRLVFRTSNYYRWMVRPALYAFADAGILAHDRGHSDLRADAGLGSTWVIRLRPGVDPFEVRIDFPLFLNRIPSTDSEYVAFRYLIGIKRAF